MTQQPFERGPYLNAAVLCERVLNEADGVNSLIRIVDRITITGSGPDVPTDMPSTVHNLWLYVAFKSGSARGMKELTIRIQKPSGESPPATPVPLNFEGEDDRGANLIVQMALEIDVIGLWWFDLALDGVPLTKIPLRVIYFRQATQPGQLPGQRQA